MLQGNAGEQLQNKHLWRVLKGALLAGLVACSAGLSAAGCKTLLVVEKRDAMLAAYDTALGRLLWRSPAGTDPHEVVVAPGGKRALVSNYGGPGSELHVLDVHALPGGRHLAPIDLAPFRSPHGLAVADGAILFTAESSKAIGRLDPATDRVTWSLGIGQDRTHMLLAAEKAIITANVSSGTVSIAEPVQIPFAGARRPDWKVTSIPVGDGVQGIDITPDGRFLWAAATREGQAVVVDLASRQPVAHIVLPWKSGNRLKITRDGQLALIGSEQLVAIDTQTHTVRTLAIGTTRAEGILLSPDGARAYVALPQEARVAVLRLPELALDSYIATGALPDGMACQDAATPAG